MIDGHKLLYAIEMLADIIIEKEGAFGMTFGRLQFEGRYKCNNTIAYCRNRSRSGLTAEEAAEALLAMREYLREEMGIKDEHTSE